MSEFLILVLAGASTFTIVVMVQELNGPFDIFLKFRELVGIWEEAGQKMVEDKFFAKLVSCPWCFSTWVSLPVLAILFLILGKDTPVMLFPFFWLTSIAISGILYSVFK